MTPWVRARIFSLFKTSRFYSMPKLLKFLNYKAKVLKSIGISKQRPTILRRIKWDISWQFYKNFRLLAEDTERNKPRRNWSFLSIPFPLSLTRTTASQALNVNITVIITRIAISFTVTLELGLKQRQFLGERIVHEQDMLLFQRKKSHRALHWKET